MALHGFDFQQQFFAFKLHLKGGNTFEMEIGGYHLWIVGVWVEIYKRRSTSVAFYSS